jgi:hypothetical protein
MANRNLVTDSYQIDDFSECYVVAEIGHSHQGSVGKAKDLFRSAKECGINAFKLQKRNNTSLYTQAIYDQTYENRNSYGPTNGAHREALEFRPKEYRERQQYAGDLGVTMFATAFVLQARFSCRNGHACLQDRFRRFEKRSTHEIRGPVRQANTCQQKGGGTIQDVSASTLDCQNGHLAPSH